MKLPSIFKTASHQRFAIKTRYYDPIKEELEERTSRIKKELEEEGAIASSSEEESARRASSLKGSFSSHRGMKHKNTHVFNASTLIRTFLFLSMVTAAFGYIYLGPVIFTYMGYGALVLGGVYFFFKFKKKRTHA